MESWLFLGIILLVALLAHNQSLWIAVGVVMLLKLLPFTQTWLTTLQSKGINWGVTIISMAILVPIATGEITFHDLINAFKTPAGYIAVACGVLVSLLSAKGVGLLASTPEMTVALVFGTIMGVVLLKGVAAGPVIAAGITYTLLTILHIGIH